MRKTHALWLILIFLFAVSGCGKSPKEYAADYNNSFSITQNNVKNMKDSFNEIIDKGGNDRQTDLAANKYINEKIMPELSAEIAKYKAMKANDNVSKLHSFAIQYLESVNSAFAEFSKAVDKDESAEVATPRLLKLYINTNQTLHAYKNEYSKITTGNGLPLLTLDKFEKINTGMSYAKVVNTVGMIGVEKSQNEVGNAYIGKIISVRYDWKDGYGPGFITCIFQNGKLVSKSQTGLN